MSGLISYVWIPAHSTTVDGLSLLFTKQIGGSCNKFVLCGFPGDATLLKNFDAGTLIQVVRLIDDAGDS